MSKKVEIKFESPKNNISDELSHSLLHTVIDEQNKNGEFDSSELFFAIRKLSDHLLDQLISSFPEEDRKNIYKESKELYAPIKQTIADKCDKKIDWLVLELTLNTMMLLAYEHMQEDTK